jgi:hypothetical protein
MNKSSLQTQVGKTKVSSPWPPLPFLCLLREDSSMKSQGLVPGKKPRLLCYHGDPQPKPPTPVILTYFLMQLNPDLSKRRGKQREPNIFCNQINSPSLGPRNSLGTSAQRPQSNTVPAGDRGEGSQVSTPTTSCQVCVGLSLPGTPASVPSGLWLRHGPSLVTGFQLLLLCGSSCATCEKSQ